MVGCMVLFELSVLLLIGVLLWSALLLLLLRPSSPSMLRAVV
jgi:hypothetical protein